MAKPSHFAKMLTLALVSVVILRAAQPSFAQDTAPENAQPTMIPVNVGEFQRINYPPAHVKNRLFQSELKDTYELPNTLPVSNPQFKIYMQLDLVSTFSQRFIQDTLPKLRERYPDTLELEYQHSTLGFFDKEVAINSIVLIECLRQQNQFWQNLQLLTQHANPYQQLLPATYLPNVDQARLSRCINSVSAETKETLYRDATNLVQTLPSNGIPTFVIANLQKPDQTPLVLLGAHPFEHFVQTFEYLQNELSHEEVDQLKADYAQISDELVSCQAQVQTYQNLNFWQKLKILLGSTSV